MHTVDASDNGPSSGTGLDALDADLRDQLHPLIDSIRVAISSYAGMSVTLIIGGHTVTVTALDESAKADIATSLLLPLTAFSAVEPGSVLTLYATTAGAFVDLAADISYALTLHPDALQLDRDVHRPRPVTGVTGTLDLSLTNQAIGVLIDQGHTPDQARTHLHHLATRHHDGGGT